MHARVKLTKLDQAILVPLIVGFRGSTAVSGWLSRLLDIAHTGEEGRTLTQN
jgi:hypothetical protein